MRAAVSRPDGNGKQRGTRVENLWLFVVVGGPAIILIAVIAVLLQRRRRYQPDVRSPDYETGGNKYVGDSADKTRRM